MKEICKCHGVSGSCSVKVCWKVMPDFRVIGDELMKRYNKASQIKDVQAKKRVEKLMILNRRSTTQSKTSRRSHIPAYKDDLIFIDKSPNFCKRDMKFDTLGTSGRMCSLSNASPEKKSAIAASRLFFHSATKQRRQNQDLNKPIESCDYLCCGRGYFSRTIEIEEDCDCQFQWCCSVKCKKCKKKIVQYYCN